MISWRNLWCVTPTSSHLSHPWKSLATSSPTLHRWASIKQLSTEESYIPVSVNKVQISVECRKPTVANPTKDKDTTVNQSKLKVITCTWHEVWESYSQGFGFILIGWKGGACFWTNHVALWCKTNCFWHFDSSITTLNETNSCNQGKKLQFQSPSSCSLWSWVQLKFKLEAWASLDLHVAVKHLCHLRKLGTKSEDILESFKV